jgi:predicted transposase YdaD
MGLSFLEFLQMAHRQGRFRYDAVVKDLFQRDRPTLLGKLIGPAEVHEFLNSELPVVEERIADILLALRDGTLFHLEFQSANDRFMPFRVGTYGLLAARKYKRTVVRQVVIYMGSGPMRMRDKLDLGGIQVNYRLVDIRQFDAAELMASGNPGDMALAMLARGGGERLGEIIRQACELPELERNRVLTQMAVLAGLRQLSARFTMEVRNMGVYVEVEKNEFLREIRDSGIELGRTQGMESLLKSQLEARFGPLPRWASDRLVSATPEQIQHWALQLVTANSLEAVLAAR